MCSPTSGTVLRSFLAPRHTFFECPVRVRHALRFERVLELAAPQARDFAARETSIEKHSLRCATAQSIGHSASPPAWSRKPRSFVAEPDRASASTSRALLATPHWRDRNPKGRARLDQHSHTRARPTDHAKGTAPEWFSPPHSVRR